MGIADWIEIGGMDALGRMDTPLHRLDARAKAAATVFFIVAVMSFGRYTLSALMPFFVFPAALVALGRIPLRPMLRKMLVALPFALVVGLFNPLLDRQPVPVGPGWTLAAGWISFASILVRFALTVGAALVLIAGTGMYRLAAGLERLGMPRVFATQLLFLYRYLFVTADQGVKMMRSVELRAPGAGGLRPRLYGALVGNLLLRSMDRAERVHRAMTARGFDGQVKVLRPSRFGARDAAFLLGWLAFFAAARAWNLSDLLGRLLTGALGS